MPSTLSLTYDDPEQALVAFQCLQLLRAEDHTDLDTMPHLKNILCRASILEASGEQATSERAAAISAIAGLPVPRYMTPEELAQRFPSLPLSALAVPPSPRADYDLEAWTKSPPEGREWHRPDWTKQMLGEIHRPLMVGERPRPGIDEYWNCHSKRWYTLNSNEHNEPNDPLTSDEGDNWRFRTRRSVRTEEPQAAPILTEPETPHEVRQWAYGQVAARPPFAPVNPFNHDTQPALFEAWEDGATEAGLHVLYVNGSLK